MQNNNQLLTLDKKKEIDYFNKRKKALLLGGGVIGVGLTGLLASKLNSKRSHRTTTTTGDNNENLNILQLVIQPFQQYWSELETPPHRSTFSDSESETSSGSERSSETRQDTVVSDDHRESYENLSRQVHELKIQNEDLTKENHNLVQEMDVLKASSNSPQSESHILSHDTDDISSKLQEAEIKISTLTHLIEEDRKKHDELIFKLEREKQELKDENLILNNVNKQRETEINNLRDIVNETKKLADENHKKLYAAEENNRVLINNVQSVQETNASLSKDLNEIRAKESKLKTDYEELSTLLETTHRDLQNETNKRNFLEEKTREEIEHYTGMISTQESTIATLKEQNDRKNPKGHHHEIKRLLVFKNELLFEIIKSIVKIGNDAHSQSDEKDKESEEKINDKIKLIFREFYRDIDGRLIDKQEETMLFMEITFEKPQNIGSYESIKYEYAMKFINGMNEFISSPPSSSSDFL